MLCCTGFAVLFGALLCFALLCCAVLCFTVLGFAVLCCAVLCFAVLCCTVFGSYSRVIGLNSEQSVKCSSKVCNCILSLIVLLYWTCNCATAGSDSIMPEFLHSYDFSDNSAENQRGKYGLIDHVFL